MNLDDIKQQFTSQLSEVTDERSLSAIEVEFLGRKGKLTAVLKGLSELDLVEKKRMGAAANELKEWIASQLKVESEKLKVAKWAKIAESERQDINADFQLSTLKLDTPPGHLHPLSNFIFNIERIFQEMGYEVVDGYEIEEKYFNFTALGIPEDHPARDESDTFFIKDLGDLKKSELILRTQTSAMQVRYMRDHPQPPIKIIIPGKTYRKDDDASHSPMFHQCEGLVVGKNITFADLKGALAEVTRKLLGPDVKMRFRSSYFPFTEPSVEVDVTCTICDGKGCNVCKMTGWLEVFPAGMVHPDVLRNGGIDPDVYSAFAFCIGIDRFAMMKHKIPSIKLLFENDIRFLEQF